MVCYGRDDALDLLSQRQLFPGVHLPLCLEKADYLENHWKQSVRGQAMGMGKSWYLRRGGCVLHVGHGCRYECVHRLGGKTPTNLDF